MNYTDMIYNKDLSLSTAHGFGFINPSVCLFVQTKKMDGEMHFCRMDVIKEVLDEDLELYDFYKTNYNYFKTNIFKTWIKVGNDLEDDGRRKLSDITYCRRVIFHPKKSDEEWEDIEYLGM